MSNVFLYIAQRAQDAQTGYCADYCATNQPMAYHEIKEFQKGQPNAILDLLAVALLFAERRGHIHPRWRTHSLHSPVHV